MRRVGRVLAWVLFAVVVAVCGAQLGLAGTRSSQPPECVTITVQALQPDGTTRSTHLEFCGNGGPDSDSALHDWVAGRTFTLDGAVGIGNGCGSKASPCVIFGP